MGQTLATSPSCSILTWAFSPRTDPVTPDAWHGGCQSAHFEVTGVAPPGKNPLGKNSVLILGVVGVNKGRGIDVCPVLLWLTGITHPSLSVSLSL